jgi:hypothetical protein
MPAKQESAAKADSPVALREELVLHGGLLSEPIIIPSTSISKDSTGALYVKLAVAEKWLCLMATGIGPKKRPLGNCAIFETLKDLIAKSLTKATQDEQEPLTGLAALGLDAEDKVFDDAHFKKQKKKRARLGAQDWAAISVPVKRESTQRISLNVLLRSGRDAPWMHLTERNLSWLRDYIHSEITQGAEPRSTRSKTSTEASSPEDAFQEAAPFDPDGDGIWWCNANTSWRVSASVPDSKTHVRKDVYVPRAPEENFRERVQAAFDQAKDLKRRLERGEQVVAKRKRRSNHGCEEEAGEKAPLSELQDGARVSDQSAGNFDLLAALDGPEEPEDELQDGARVSDQSAGNFDLLAALDGPEVPEDELPTMDCRARWRASLGR